jgi:hypothetical protein
MPDDVEPQVASQSEGEPSPEGSEFDSGTWLQGLDQRQRSAIDEYAAFKAKPVESEMHGLRSEVGRLKKATDPAVMARLGHEERLVEQAKTMAVAIFGNDVADEIKDMETLDEISVAFRFLSKGRQPAAPAAPIPADRETQDAFAEFLASRQANGETRPRNGAAVERMANVGSGVKQQSLADLIAKDTRRMTHKELAVHSKSLDDMMRRR